MSEDWFAPSPAARKVALAVGAVAVAIIIVLIATNRDISAAQDFQADVIARPDAGPIAIEHYRFADPSPYCVWIPSDLHVRRNIREGHLPLWDRRQGGGYSPLTNVQNGVLHPLRWMLALIPEAQAPSALIVLGMALAFAGMIMLLAEGYRLSLGASIVGAFLFCFTGNGLSTVHFSGMLVPIAHLPWLLWAWRAGVGPGSGGGRRRAGVTAFFIGLMALILIAGHPGGVLAVVLTAALAMLADMALARDWRPLRLVAFSACAALMIDAVAILPAALASSEVWTYKRFTPQGLTYVPMAPGEWLRAAVAVVLRGNTGSPHIDHSSLYRFAGPCAIALAAIGIAVARRRRDRAFLLALLPIAFAIVIPGPWMRFATFVPIWRNLNPWYFATAFCFGVAIAAAIGFDALAARFGWHRRSLAVFAAVALIALPFAGDYATVYHLAPARPFTASTAVRFLRALPEPLRITGLGGQTHLANSSELTGIEDLRFTSPLLSRRYHEWFALVDPEVLAKSPYPTTRITDRLGSPLVAGFAVSHIIVSRMPTTRMKSEIAPEGSRTEALLARGDAQRFSREIYPLVLSTAWLEIRKVAGTPRPRAHFAVAIRVVRDLTEATQLLRSDSSLPLRANVVEVPAGQSVSVPAIVDPGRVR
ncbi:MAG TPA: hypothetical protein VEZ11_15145, partial [Thermoanaerobaculia bacterium]|nr:hypothetical protein [Thermoanaerobaculia bacterium]